MYKSDEQKITEFYEMLDTSQDENQEIIYDDDEWNEDFNWDEDFGAYEASKSELDKLLEEEEE